MIFSEYFFFQRTGIRIDSLGRRHKTGFEGRLGPLRICKFSLPSKGNLETDKRDARIIFELGRLHVLITLRAK